MTNFEKYHKESIEKGYTAVKNGKLTSCDDIICNECDLNNEHEGCFITLLRWFAEEYKEPKPKLTEKEMHLCKAFDSGYIARDKSGSLFFYTSKPEKSVVVWHLDDCELDRLKRVQNETEIDWSKVVIDTPILVSNDGNKWLNRYFAKYTGGKVYAFANGSTSWSFDKKDCKLKDWKYVKLANS